MSVQESLDFIVQKMATKSDIEEIKKTQDEQTETLGEHTRILGQHTKMLGEHATQLNNIHADIKTMRDKRLQLEVRVDHIEKHLHIKPSASTTSR